MFYIASNTYVIKSFHYNLHNHSKTAESLVPSVKRCCKKSVKDL